MSKQAYMAYKLRLNIKVRSLIMKDVALIFLPV